MMDSMEAFMMDSMEAIRMIFPPETSDFENAGFCSRHEH
jgi:hypothetical protein